MIRDADFTGWSVIRDADFTGWSAFRDADFNRGTWQAPRGIAREAGHQAAAHAIHLDLVLHAEALEALASIEQVPAEGPTVPGQ